MAHLELCPVSTEEELAELRLRRLKWTVNHAYVNSEFYRKKLRVAGVEPGDIRTLDDIAKLPFTDKDDLS